LVNSAKEIFSAQEIVGHTHNAQPLQLLNLEQFKRRAMNNKIVLNCIYVFEFMLGTTVKEMEATLGTSRLFGRNLDEVLRSEGRKPPQVPKIVEQCIEYLQQPETLQSKGLFRLSPSFARFCELKHAVDVGKCQNILVYIHTTGLHKDGGDGDGTIPLIALLLKQFLGDLPDPLCTYSLYDSFLAVSKEDIPLEQKIEMLQHLLNMLPPANRALISQLLPFFRKVVSFSDQNLMGSANLATVFVRSFLRRRSQEDPMKELSEIGQCQSILTMIINHGATLNLKSMASLSEADMLRKELQRTRKEMNDTIDRLTEQLREKEREVEQLKHQLATYAGAQRLSKML